MRRHDRRALWFDLIRPQRPLLEAAGDSHPLFSSDPAAHGISLAADRVSAVSTTVPARSWSLYCNWYSFQ